MITHFGASQYVVIGSEMERSILKVGEYGT